MYSSSAIKDGEATSPGGLLKGGSRSRVQALSPTSLYNKNKSLNFIAMSVPKTNKALMYKHSEEDKMMFNQRKKQKKMDCVRVDVRALLRLRDKNMSLQDRNRSTDSDEKEEETEVESEEVEEENIEEEEEEEVENIEEEEEETEEIEEETDEEERPMDESFTKKNDKKPDIKLESMKQDTEFSVGSEVSVWWKDGKDWDGKVLDILLHENAVVVGFEEPYDGIEFTEVFCIDGGSIAPKGQLHLLRRLGRVERQVFEKRSRELTALWRERVKMKRHKDSDDTTTSSKMKRRRLIMDKTTTATTTTTTSTAAADEYWGVLGEDFQWYDRLDLWSSTRQILGQTAHLGYFRDAENASKVTTEVNRRLLHWSYEMLLTARYQLFDAHNHFARNHGGIVVGTNGRVYIEDDLKYKCAGGRKAEGRYGEMLPAFIHKMVLECLKRLGRDKLSKAVIYDLGAGLGNVGAQFAHEIDGCRVVGIENEYNLVRCARKYLSYLEDLEDFQRCAAEKPFERLEYYYGDFFQQSLRDATIVVANNVAFPDKVNERLFYKLARETKPGTIVILTGDMPYANRMSKECRKDGRSATFARRHPDHPALSFHWTCIEPKGKPSKAGLGLKYKGMDEETPMDDEEDDDRFVDRDADELYEVFTDIHSVLENRKWVSWGGGKVRKFYIMVHV